MARASNVSVGTVSKALNNNGSLRQETREKVIAVARELGFRPNDLAQSLHRGQSLTVGLISTDAFGRFTIPIMEGLEECLSDSRMAVFMCNATDDPEREAQHVEQLLGKRVDGIVVTAPPRRPAPEADGSRATSRCSTSSRRATTQTPAASSPTTRAAPCSRRRTSSARPRADRPRHRAGTVRGRAAAARRLPQGARDAGLPAPEGFYLPGVWSEGWGREAVAQLFSGAGERPTRSSAATTRSPAASPMRCASAASSFPTRLGGRLRQLGDHRRGDAAAAHHRRHESRRARPRGRSPNVGLIAGGKRKGVERLRCTLVVRQSCGHAGFRRRPAPEADMDWPGGKPA